MSVKLEKRQSASPPVRQSASPPVRQSASPPVRQSPVRQSAVRQSASPPVRQSARVRSTYTPLELKSYCVTALLGSGNWAPDGSPGAPAYRATVVRSRTRLDATLKPQCPTTLGGASAGSRLRRCGAVEPLRNVLHVAVSA